MGRTYKPKGTKVNTKKTKTPNVNERGEREIITCRDDTLEEITTIYYLRTKISNDGKWDIEIQEKQHTYITR